MMRGSGSSCVEPDRLGVAGRGVPGGGAERGVRAAANSGVAERGVLGGQPMVSPPRNTHEISGNDRLVLKFGRSTKPGYFRQSGPLSATKRVFHNTFLAKAS